MRQVLLCGHMPMIRHTPPCPTSPTPGTAHTCTRIQCNNPPTCAATLGTSTCFECCLPSLTPRSSPTHSFASFPVLEATVTQASTTRALHALPRQHPPMACTPAVYTCLVYGRIHGQGNRRCLIRTNVYKQHPRHLHIRCLGILAYPQQRVPYGHTGCSILR